MINLKGTEKQISWATEIRQINIARLNQEIQDFKERGLRENYSYENLIVKFEKAIEELEIGHPDSKWWIANRSISLAYIQICKKQDTQKQKVEEIKEPVIKEKIETEGGNEMIKKINEVLKSEDINLEVVMKREDNLSLTLKENFSIPLKFECLYEYYVLELLVDLNDTEVEYKGVYVTKYNNGEYVASYTS